MKFLATRQAARVRMLARTLMPALVCAGALTQALEPASAAARPTAPGALFAQECAACHIAYPPNMLPASSWRHLMASLERHFGTDASLDAAATAAVAGWLETNAGRAEPAPVPQDRITRSAWFAREHEEAGRKRRAGTAPRSMSDCAACHADATRGRFGDD
jgi:mono/diheme cytochrome c family protein